MPGPSLAEDYGKVTAAKAESLLDASRHSNFRTIAWNTEALAVDPHRSSSVIHLKNALPQRAKRTGGVSRNGDFLPCIFSGIAIDLRNAKVRWAAEQEEAADCDQPD